MSDTETLNTNRHAWEYSYVGNKVFLAGLITQFVMISNSAIFALVASDVFIFSPSTWLWILATEAGAILIANTWIYVNDCVTDPATDDKDVRIYSKRHFDAFLSFTVACIGTIAMVAAKLYGYHSIYGDKLDVTEFAAERDGILARADWRSGAQVAAYAIVPLAYAFYWVVVGERSPVFTDKYSSWRKKNPPPKSSSTEMSKKKEGQEKEENSYIRSVRR